MRKFMGMSFCLLVLTGVLTAQSYETSPDTIAVIPEAIWASASGGGTWQTEVQVTARDDITSLYATFYYGGGDYRDVDLGVTISIYDSFKTTNILEYLGTKDIGFDYFNKIGGIYMHTGGDTHRIQVSVRTWHSDGYAKSYNAHNSKTGNFISASGPIEGMIKNLFHSMDFRSSLACFNPDSDPISIQFWFFDAAGQLAGSVVSKTLAAGDFQAYDPFSEAGLGSGVYTNHNLVVQVQSGAGILYVIGASANNNTNDPAAHTLVIW